MYEKYPTTIEEDNEILKRTDLTFNHSNSVMMRQGEKAILLFLMKTAE